MHADQGAIFRLIGTELELAVLSAQCLDRRIPDRATLEFGGYRRLERRNTNHASANRVTTADARIKLKSLYP